jgi:UDP-N-acetylglucosamine acyltransferase
MNDIHHTAIISKNAKLGKNNKIGPFCIIGSNVTLGDGNHLHSNVVMDGQTQIGDNNEFFPFAVIGTQTQDQKYTGGLTKLRIGSDNCFREFSTVNTASDENGETVIGNHCLIMISSHIGHDCVLEDYVRITNCAGIAGHVHIGSYAIVGGLSGVHQFTRIGSHAMIGGGTAVVGDVIPYGMVVGERGHLAGLNNVGLKRRNFSKEEMRDLRLAYDIIFSASSDKIFAERVQIAKNECGESEVVRELIDFIQQDSNKNICKPKD